MLSKAGACRPPIHSKRTGHVNKGKYLYSPLGNMTQEGQVAQNIEGHGCAPNWALARQAPLPIIYRTA